MKKIYTGLLLLAAITTARAQNYIPFPSSNAIWTQREGQGDTTPTYHCYGLTTEDTLLNNFSYHKLFRSVDTVFEANECIGGMREDSMKHVFYYDFAMHQERMLYDFSVQPGDTVDYDSSSAGIVYSVDSIDISGNYHRRINFRTFNGNFWLYGSWVEGMGNASLGGLLGSALMQPTCDCADNIICFKQNGVWMYHNPLYSATDCVNDALEVGRIETAKASVRIYPNPVTGNSSLNISGLATQGMVNIYSITGTLMHSQNVSNNSSITISKSEYPSGIYFYRLSGQADQAVSGKFIVE